MRELCIDVETTTYNKGSPFDERNELVCVAYTCGGTPTVWDVRRDPAGIKILQKEIDAADRLVGFNFKFDLHWLRKSGVLFSHKRIYDVQSTEFILSGQKHKFPSLNEVSEKYLGKSKLDEVALLWDQGVQTTDIPWETLSKYAAQDVDLTLAVAKVQQKATPDSMKKLISIVNQDLLVLEEMEWNGLRFDRELSIKKAEEYEAKILELQTKHNVLHNVPNFNWGSPEHLSALLYGGTIREVVKVPVGHYKTGKRRGQIKYGNEERIHNLPRLYTPPKGGEKKKEGIYSVDEPTLQGLKGKHKELLNDLLLIKKYQKEVSTYLRGLPEKQDEGFYKDYIHGQFNQCVAATGRLSSSSPNLQNLSEEAGRCLVTRYGKLSESTQNMLR